MRERLPFFFFWPAAFGASWLGGLGPGLLATVLSAVAVVLLHRGLGSLPPGPLHAGFIVVTFCIIGMVGAVVARWRERAMADAERARREAEAAKHAAEEQRRRAEESKHAAEEAKQFAERANRAKDAFLANISHELRTPLSPILTWARMLRDGQLNAEQSQRAIEVIERNAMMQAKLVETFSMCRASPKGS
jgi:signal transduction histidine kinase